jgi:hypothetical protein
MLLQWPADPLPFPAMHDSVAAIRAGRPRTRFASQSVSHRERHLGLRRASRPPLAPAAPSRIKGHPLAALRRAVRGLRPAIGRAAPSPLAGLRRASLISWGGQADGGRRRKRARSAAPWQG